LFRNHLHIALRNFKKYRVHTLINVLGLALGIAGSAVLFLFCYHHTQYDQEWPDKERIHHLYSFLYLNGETSKMIGTPVPILEVLRQNYAGFEEGTLLQREQKGGLGYLRRGIPETYHVLKGMMGIDSSFGKLFPLEYVAGGFEAFVRSGEGVLLAEKVAIDMFGSPEAALGQWVDVYNNYPAIVAGIFKDPPKTTSFPFQVLFESTLRNNNCTSLSCLSDRMCILVKLKAGYTNEQLIDWLAQWLEQNRETNQNRIALGAVALPELHHDAGIHWLQVPAVSKVRLTRLSTVAIALLLIASFNYVNLATALANDRAQEVGTRKVLGSSRWHLVGQFLVETILITLVAVLLSLVFAEILLIYLDSYLNVTLRLRDLPASLLVSALVVVLVTVSVLAGGYPAWLLAGIRPLDVVQKKTLFVRSRVPYLRRLLVFLQFSAGQVLILVLVVVSAQLYFINHQPLGFSTEARLRVNLPIADPQLSGQLRDRVLALPGIVNTSLSQQGPAAGVNNFTFLEWRGEQHKFHLFGWDYYYQEMFGIELLAGRPLSAHDSTRAALINVQAMRALGFESPQDAIGVTLPVNFYSSELFTVEGVVADFKFLPAHFDVPPTIIYQDLKQFYAFNFQLAGTEPKATLLQVERIYHELFPNALFDYIWVEDALSQFYLEEVHMQKFFLLFAGIAMTISCLGIYGLANFMVSRKRKEVGVRKVMGAGVRQVLWMFSKEYLFLILLAFIVAVPLVVHFMKPWLARFVFKISLSWQLFALSFFMALMMAFLAVGYQSMRAARANPIQSLRYE